MQRHCWSNNKSISKEKIKRGKHTVLKALGVSDPPQQQKFERKLLFLRVADCCATPWPPASVD